MKVRAAAEFPFVEQLRAAVRRTAYVRLTDAELECQDRSDRGIVQSLAIEGLHGSPEIEALFAMLREERVPPPVALHMVGRYVRDRLAPAAAEAESAALAS